MMNSVYSILEDIQEYFSTRESVLHWLFWLRASNYKLSRELVLEELGYKLLDDKDYYRAIKVFTALFGSEHWKVSFCVDTVYGLHKDKVYPIWSQGDKYYIPELDKENNFEWDSDEELPF